MNSDLKDNHFDGQNMAQDAYAENVLREEDVDEEMFIFPDRAKQGETAEEEKIMDVPQL